MRDQKLRELKRAQKESLIRKEFSKLFLEIKLSNKNLQDIYINRVELSADKSTLFVYFFTDKGPEFFQERLADLILYKPSARKALSQILDSRYTPQLVFKYDKTFEKQCKIEALLDKVKEDDQALESNQTEPSETPCETTHLPPEDQ